MHLQQAHEAFVYGVPFAALALMRSILEITLRDHYKAPGNDLVECIRNVKKLPKSVTKNSLHRLRILANDIIHYNKDQVSVPSDMERELVAHLLTLRRLIEGSPLKPTW